MTEGPQTPCTAWVRFTSDREDGTYEERRCRSTGPGGRMSRVSFQYKRRYERDLNRRFQSEGKTVT